MILKLPIHMRQHSGRRQTLIADHHFEARVPPNKALQTEQRQAVTPLAFARAAPACLCR